MECHIRELELMTQGEKSRNGSRQRKLGEVQQYGTAPFRIALIHGGPGARGEMELVARELARHQGVLEPYQSARSVVGQVEELGRQLQEYGDMPCVLVGHSWGAWLAVLTAVQARDLVRKLVLIGCPPLEAGAAIKRGEVWRNRLSEKDRVMFDQCLAQLKDKDTPDKNRVFAQLGRLVVLADGYDVEPSPGWAQAADYVQFEAVWTDAARMRTRGEIAQAFSKIDCSLTIIHGAQDPHPAAAVIEPLQGMGRQFRSHVLDRCGHDPWLELQARESFFSILEQECQSQ